MGGKGVQVHGEMKWQSWAQSYLYIWVMKGVEGGGRREMEVVEVVPFFDAVQQVK